MGERRNSFVASTLFCNFCKRKSAVNICEDLGLPSVTHVLDPTLQVNKDFWMSLLTESQRVRTDKGKYVLVYQLNSNREFDRYAKEFAKEKVGNGTFLFEI